MKRALALILTLALLPLGALGEVALPEPEAEAPQMLLGEAEAEYFYEATLYYAASDGVSLSQATRTLLVQSGEALVDVVLEALDESDGVVRLQFSGALQSYIDGASSAAALEAISKTFRAFYEAGGRPIETLEIYAAGEPVTVGGVAVDCTVLMYGELPVSGVVEEP